MFSGSKRTAMLAVVLALSGVAMAKPAHVLYHLGKGIAYPLRHPQKAGHGLLKFLKGVF